MSHTTVVSLLAVLVLPLFSVACSPSCESLCEESIVEGCAPVTLDCAMTCLEAERAAARTGCESEQDDYFSCAGDGNVCTAEDRCGREASRLSACGEDYCALNPTDPLCP